MRAGIAWIVALCVAGPSVAGDDTFFQEAARGGMAEVALGQLAVTKGSTDSVKAFGKQMIDDHGAANGKLRAAAAKSQVTLPTDLDPDAQAMQKKLQSLSGGDFDLAYLESQSKAHAKTVELLEKEIASGTDAAAKAWAREALPTVKRHAEMVGSLDRTPGEHTLEHAVGTPGPADAPPAATPRAN